MIREDALSLSTELEELGISHTIECGIYDQMAPRINYRVRPSSSRLQPEQIKELMALAEEHELQLMFTGLDLSFVSKTRVGLGA